MIDVRLSNNLWSIANQYSTEEYILDYLKGGTYLNNKDCAKAKSEDASINNWVKSKQIKSIDNLILIILGSKE